MAERKDTLAASSEKAPDVQKPKAARELSWSQARFVEAYLEHRNPTAAALKAHYTPAAARKMGRYLLGQPYIQEAISIARAEARLKIKKLGFDRNKALEIMIAIAMARVSDFHEVLKDVNNRDKFAKLGNLEHAIKKIKHTEFGVDLELSDKVGAIEKLWQWLDFGNTHDSGNWADGLADLLELSRRAQKGKSS